MSRAPLFGRSGFGAVIAILTLSSAVLAQGSGSVQGAVTAASERPVAHARVAIQLPARVAITDNGGRYVLHDVPAGHYELLITALGYKPVRRSVDVRAGQRTSVDATLEPGSLMLSSVVTTATRVPVEASRVAATVNVLTPYQIQTSPARESQDLLREIPGVELPRTSSQVGGSAQIVSIRGVDEGRTVVTFDGVPITDAWGEWVDWSKVPKGMLDRVEVVEGGTSNLYGNGAMGGAISFFSRPMAPGSYMLSADAGNRDARHGFLAAGIPLYGPLSASIVGDYGDGGGYTLIAPANRGPVDQPSESIRRNAFARIEYSPSSRLSAYVTGHLFSDNRDLGTALSQTNRRSSAVDLAVDYGAATTGQFSLRAWNSEQREDQFTSAISTVGGVARAAEARNAWLHIPSHDWGAGMQWNRAGLFGTESFAVGADFRHLNGFTDEIDYSTTTGAQTGNLYGGGDQVLSGVFAQAIIAPLSRVRVELGARVDHWGNNNGIAIVQTGTTAPTTTTFENRTRDAFSPRAGIRFQVAPTLALHTAAYQAFRAPNLAELYRRFNSGANQNLPNPALRPEYATGYEAGFDWQPRAWVQLKGTAYNADMRDLNSFVTIAPNQRRRENIQKTRSRGGEAYLALRPLPALFVSASINYDDDKVVANAANPASVGARVGRVPVQKEVLRVSYTTPALGSWTVIGRHEGVTTTLQGVPLAPYTVVDANVQRELLPGISAFVSVENIGDTEYQVALTSLNNGVASLGLPRTVRIGVNVVKY